jgi:benzoyl-CoA reductase/2-hydroxyglutaryl-CoA dehydratase subunit BcrC/BadD/HgdB
MGKMSEKHKQLESSSTLKALMTAYFNQLAGEKRRQSQKIAWCSSVGPVELLRAMGFLVYFPENHGAMLGFSQQANDYIPKSNALGYSPDICSYLTSDIGAYLSKASMVKQAYGIDIPVPDVIVYNTNQCREIQNWFSFYARQFDCPILGICSNLGMDSIEQSHVDSVTAQIQSMIPVLESISGRTFQFKALSDTVALSSTTSALWNQVLETSRNHPAPLSFFDASIHMAPAVLLRGTPEANDYYETLLSELHWRIENQTGAVDNESFRIYWEGMPIWSHFRFLSALFQSMNACVVASTYCNSWIFDALDPEFPITSMAEAYLKLFITRSESYKENYLTDMCRKFGIDGMVFHDARTCPANSNNRYGLPVRLREKTGLSFLVIEGDMNDMRYFSKDQTRIKVQAFMEILGAAK